MGKNKIKVGDKAPSFKIESFNEGMIDLSELIGDQKIVVIFSRYFGCPICQLDFNILLEAVPEIKEKGAKLLYITQSGEKVAKEFIEKYNVDFPIIPSFNLLLTFVTAPAFINPNPYSAYSSSLDEGIIGKSTLYFSINSLSTFSPDWVT